MEDRTAKRSYKPVVCGPAGRRPSGPARGRLRLLRPGIAVVLGAGAVAVCVSVVRPAPAASQRAANLAVPMLSVAATQPSTTSGSTPSATTAATAPRTTSATTTSTYRPRTTYTTRQSPTTSYSRSTASTDTTTTTPAPTTTVAPLGGPGLPAPPSTLPLTTKKQNGHVNPVFAELSGVGFFIVLVLIAVQALLTRRGGKGHSL